MAMTLDPARPSPGAGKYPLDPGRFDEAFAAGGTPRTPYAAVLDALARHDLVVLRERVQASAAALGSLPRLVGLSAPISSPRASLKS